MQSIYLPQTLLRALFVSALLFFLAPMCDAQPPLAPPPTASPAESEVKVIEEDLTSPALSKGPLHALPPMAAPVADRESNTFQLVRLQWRAGDPIDLYVIKPKGVVKPPVILFLYGFPTETDQFTAEGFQQAATSGGFAAVGFVPALTGPRYHDRPLKSWFVSELQESLATTSHDVPMILDYLTKRGDLDMSRVGMYAQGSGASIAIMASAVDPRIKVLDTIDPWGDWPGWLAASPVVPELERKEYTKPQFLQKVATLDPVEWLPKIQAKKFRMQDVIFEPNTPKVAKEKLRAAIPPGQALLVYKTQGDIDEFTGGDQALAWIKNALQALPKTQADETQPKKPATKPDTKKTPTSH